MNKFNPDEIKKMFDKIIPRAAGERVFLHKAFFKRLTDREFSILWYMPGVDIIVSDDTRAYIERRRLDLDLVKTKHAHDIELT
jgi:hypothetical protein